MVRWLRRYKYEAVIHGMESGTTTPIPAVRFKTEREADLWVQKMNQARKNALTMWDYREIPR